MHSAMRDRKRPVSLPRSSASSYCCSATQPLTATASCWASQPPFDSRRSPQYSAVCAAGQRHAPRHGFGAPRRARGVRQGNGDPDHHYPDTGHIAQPTPSCAGCVCGPHGNFVEGPAVVRIHASQVISIGLAQNYFFVVRQLVPPTAGLGATGSACPATQGV